jgi:hypothetical protein
MSTKTLKINPNLFNINKGGNKRERIKKPSTKVKTGKVRDAFIQKIKNHRKKEKRDGLEKDEQLKNTLSDLEQSIEYLKELSEEKQKKRTLKNKNRMESGIQLELPEDLQEHQVPLPEPNTTIVLAPSTNEPPYGCLKNGAKPTMRNWKKEISVTTGPQNEINIEFNDDDDKVNDTPNQDALEKIKREFNQEQEIKPNEAKIIRKKRKKKTYRLGKTGRHIGVLIKNSDTRKKVNEEFGSLKKERILTIKNYLKKKNLIKTGCEAPHQVLRHMYEQAVLCGDVKNVASENLVHNYMNDK